MLGREPAWHHFRGPVHHVSAEVLMADIFTKWLPMETFHAKAPLSKLSSSLHVRVGKYLERLGKDAYKSSPLHSRKVLLRALTAFQATMTNRTYSLARNLWDLHFHKLV